MPQRAIGRLSQDRAFLLSCEYTPKASSPTKRNALQDAMRLPESKQWPRTW